MSIPMTPIMVVTLVVSSGDSEDSGLSGFVVLFSFDSVCVVIGSPGVVLEVP